jgi:hypothetical protein
VSDIQHEAYRPIIDDGRGLFPEDLRVKAPRGSRAAIAAAAEIKHTSHTPNTFGRPFSAALMLMG